MIGVKLNFRGKIMKERDYVVLTDSNSELPLELVKKHDLHFVPMPLVIDGVESKYQLGLTDDAAGFFDKIRNGAMPTTNTYPPNYYIEFFSPFLKAGQDILYISFSSRLSAAFEFITLAAMELRETYPNRRIELYDTLNISGGMSIQLEIALDMYAEGKEMDEIIAKLDIISPTANAWFTVNDLNHLRRGGRIPATTAIVGTILSVKPILCVDARGKLVPAGNAMGRKKSIRELAKMVIEKSIDSENNSLVILHGDCIKDAESLLKKIQDQVKFKTVYIQLIGPVIGSHCGPDTLGVSFFGEDKPAISKEEDS